MDPGKSESLIVQLPSKWQLPLGMPFFKRVERRDNVPASPRIPQERAAAAPSRSKSMAVKGRLQRQPSAERPSRAHAPSAACPGVYAGRACAATEPESAGPARPIRRCARIPLARSLAGNHNTA